MDSWAWWLWWIISLLPSVVVPLFLAYLAAAAYALQRRRGDIAAASKLLDDMHELTFCALERIEGAEVDERQVQRILQRLVMFARFEALHRPQEVQRQLLELVRGFLDNAHVAMGRREDTRDQVISRITTLEDTLVDMLRQFTVVEAIKQAWQNPGVLVSFSSLYQRFAEKNPSNNS